MRWILATVLATAAATSSCANFHDSPWEGRLFVLDSAKASLTRSQDGGEVIACGDKKAEGMICMSSPDFSALLTRYRGMRASCPDPETPAAK